MSSHLAAAPLLFLMKLNVNIPVLIWSCDFVFSFYFKINGWPIKVTARDKSASKGLFINELPTM